MLNVSVSLKKFVFQSWSVGCLIYLDNSCSHMHQILPLTSLSLGASKFRLVPTYGKRTEKGVDSILNLATWSVFEGIKIPLEERNNNWAFFKPCTILGQRLKGFASTSAQMPSTTENKEFWTNLMNVLKLNNIPQCTRAIGDLLEI